MSTSCRECPKGAGLELANDEGLEMRYFKVISIADKKGDSAIFSNTINAYIYINATKRKRNGEDVAFEINFEPPGLGLEDLEMISQVKMDRGDMSTRLSPYNVRPPRYKLV